jgi:hypothetical protein
MILDDFRKLLKSNESNSAFIIQGINQPNEHKDALLKHTSTFRRLITLRASGLHAGCGLLLEATLSQANEVASFLKLLRLSTRISPYISPVPQCTVLLPDRSLLIEDIAGRLQEAKSEGEIATALASLYLVLPDIPEDEPAWLETFERVMVTPKERDINYLLKVVESALPVSLRRSTSTGSILSVKITNENPHAIPIAPQYLKREYKKIPELWYADISSANGRLSAGSLDLPPASAVREVFAIGLVAAGILQEGSSLGPHESWVSIAASLGVQGTTGPYWFLVQQTNDLGQLTKQLQLAASSKGTQNLKNNIKAALHGIEALRKNKSLLLTDKHFSDVIEDIQSINDKRAKIHQSQERYTQNPEAQKALPESLAQKLDEVVQGESVDFLLKELISSEEIHADCFNYWGRIFCEVACKREDAAALIETLGTNKFSSGVHTAARKALRRVDFKLYGPPVKWE